MRVLLQGATSRCLSSQDMLEKLLDALQQHTHDNDKALSKGETIRVSRLSSPAAWISASFVCGEKYCI